MKLIAAALLAWLVAALPGAAQTFSLKDNATGRVYGPFDSTSGAQVVIGTNAFTVQKSEVRQIAVSFEPTMEQKLSRTIIPEIDFRNAAVEDVIEFLRKASEEHSPFKGARHKGVNIVAQLGAATPEELGSITFKAQKISLKDTLNAITSVASLEYELRDNWILVRPKPKKVKK